MRLAFELAATCPRQRIKFCSPIILTGPPIRFDPTAVLQFMQCRVKRTIADAQHIVGHLIQPTADGPAVHGLVRQDLQKQKVQGALDEVARSAHGYRVDAIFFPSISK